MKADDVEAAGRAGGPAACCELCSYVVNGGCVHYWFSRWIGRQKDDIKDEKRRACADVSMGRGYNSPPDEIVRPKPTPPRPGRRVSVDGEKAAGMARRAYELGVSNGRCEVQEQTLERQHTVNAVLEIIQLAHEADHDESVWSGATPALRWVEERVKLLAHPLARSLYGPDYFKNLPEIDADWDDLGREYDVPTPFADAMTELANESAELIRSSIMRGFRRQKPDANQADIVKRLRALPGVEVIVVNGEIDFIVGFCGKNFLFELKNPDTSHPKDRESQKRLRSKWTGEVHLVWTYEDVLSVIGHPPYIQRAE